MTRQRLRMGVLGCSEFAWRAMIPAMKETPGIELRAVASRSAVKARAFADRFGCGAVEGYAALLRRPDIDAVYIALPPALHAQWTAKSLAAGRHVLVEKPFAPSAAQASRLLALARRRRLLVMENILFPHHSLFSWVRARLASGELGAVRLLRCAFTIPPLKAGDIRYQAALGGGAFLDMGPYMVRFATAFLGDAVTLQGAAIQRDAARGVDIAGAAQFLGTDGGVAQTAFGFDAQYRCSWEFFGTKGSLSVERGFTAKPDHAPVARLEGPQGAETLVLPADNHYKNMCRAFSRTALDGGSLRPHWDAVARQALYMDQIRRRAAQL